jgi:hypothetical protein
LPDRTSDNDKRALLPDMPPEPDRQALIARISYEGYGKHKKNPHIWKVAVYHGDAEDRTFCEDAGLRPTDMRRATRIVQRGVAAGLMGDRSDLNCPTILWTIDDNGWIYELRLTNRDQAVYHGYPVRFNDAMARKVIVRFQQWVNLEPAGRLAPAQADRLALQAAQDLYT